jgi:hypothetical protein
VPIVVLVAVEPIALRNILATASISRHSAKEDDDLFSGISGNVVRVATVRFLSNADARQPAVANDILYGLPLRHFSGGDFGTVRRGVRATNQLRGFAIPSSHDDDAKTTLRDTKVCGIQFVTGELVAKGTKPLS